jgi:single-stranded-DNA-specific exonuclease
MPSQPRPEPHGREAVSAAFAEALAGFDRTLPTLVMGHFDADGLSALAIIARALEADGREVAVRIVGKGENPWSDAIRAELADRRLGGIVAADLGVRPGVIKANTPTVVIDHHVPTGEPTEATVITGHGMDPIPTSSLARLLVRLGPDRPRAAALAGHHRADRRHGGGRRLP